MNCCDDYGQCRQGHGCPAREQPVDCPRPRLRAGGPPPAELPQPTAPLEESAGGAVPWRVPLAIVAIIAGLLLAAI